MTDPGQRSGRLVLPVTPPFDGTFTLRWGRFHRVTSCDTVTDTRWVRRDSDGTITMEPSVDRVTITFDPSIPGRKDAATALTRRIFGLDDDITGATNVLRDDPVIGPLIAARPGLRICPYPDPFEGVIRTIVGQQVSDAAAARLMDKFDDMSLGPGLPRPETLTKRDLSSLGMPRSRIAALSAVIDAIVDGLDLSGATPSGKVRDELLAIKGIGPWTAGCVQMLVLDDPDGWPSGDLALRKQLDSLTGRTHTNRELDRFAERWRPWRGVAAMHLWAAYLADALNASSA